MISIKTENYPPFGDINVGYVAVNGRQACVLYDPTTNPMRPFETYEGLYNYLVALESDFSGMPTISDSPTTDDAIFEWRNDLFWQRFTDAERILIHAAAKDDLNIEDFKMHLLMTPVVVSNNSITLKAMTYLVVKGLLTEERKNQILGGN